jgi:hypothetical protein
LEVLNASIFRAEEYAKQETSMMDLTGKAAGHRRNCFEVRSCGHNWRNYS